MIIIEKFLFDLSSKAHPTLLSTTIRLFEILICSTQILKEARVYPIKVMTGTGDKIKTVFMIFLSS